MMRSTVFAAVAVGSVVALVGFAGAANASATVDLIWAANGLNEISNVNVTSTVTLQVILTAGPNGSQGGGVSVDYSGTLPKLVVTGFMSTPGGPLPIHLGTPEDTGSRIQNISCASIPPFAGIGLPAGQTHQLGTVTFHKSQLLGGTLEIRSDANGPVDGVIDLTGTDITATITFNSAYIKPFTDTDSDGIPDGTDNCPFVSNNSQTNSDPLPAGDACQCGDVTGDGGVTLADVTRAQENLLGIPLGGTFDATRCNVIGPSNGGVSDCDIADIFILQRFLAGSPVTVGNTCDAYSAP